MSAPAVAVRERPILFSGEMVRAILDGRKTQTRRVVAMPSYIGHRAELTRIQPGFADGTTRPVFDDGDDPNAFSVRCPYGQPGDRLWVRETWALNSVGVAGPPWVHSAEIGYRADDGEVSHRCPAEFCKAERDRLTDLQWRPSIHMPRWASRLTLEITDVRVERVQDITAADAEAEGVLALPEEMKQDAARACAAAGRPTCTARDYFAQLWNSINGARGYGWDANPWVWVLEFRRVES